MQIFFGRPTTAVCPIHRGRWLTTDRIIIAPYLGQRSSKNFKKIFSDHLDLKKNSSTGTPNIKISENNRVWKSRRTTSVVKIFLYFLHSKFELESREIGVGYKITPAEVRKRPTLPGLFRLSILCGIFLNSPGCPSFHSTIKTPPVVDLPQCPLDSSNRRTPIVPSGLLQ